MLNALVVEPIRADPAAGPREFAPIVQDLREQMKESAGRGDVEKVDGKLRGYTLTVPGCIPADVRSELLKSTSELRDAFLAKRKEAAPAIALTSPLGIKPLEVEAVQDAVNCVAANLLPSDYKDLQKGAAYCASIAGVSIDATDLKSVLKCGSKVRNALVEKGCIVSPAVLSSTGLKAMFDAQKEKKKTEFFKRSVADKFAQLDQKTQGIEEKVDRQGAEFKAKTEELDTKFSQGIGNVHVELAKNRAETQGLMAQVEELKQRRSRSRSPRVQEQCAAFSPYYVPASPFSPFCMSPGMQAGTDGPRALPIAPPLSFGFN